MNDCRPEPHTLAAPPADKDGMTNRLLAEVARLLEENRALRAELRHARAHG